VLDPPLPYIQVMQILNTDILQGTVVRRDGIFSDCFVANLRLIVTVKEFENQSAFAEDMDCI